MKCPRLFGWFPGGVLAAAVVAAFPAGAQDVGSLTFEELRSQVTQSDQTTGSLDAGAAMVAEWVDANDLASQPLAEMDLWWLLDHLIRAEIKGNVRDFSVTWTGLVIAPVSGQYTFSHWPYNVNFDHVTAYARQTISISINGQEVLNSTPSAFVSTATPVELQADTPVPLLVEFSFDSLNSIASQKPPLITLFWEGPGVPRAVVPASAVRVPDDSTDGLQAEYRSTVGGEAQTWTQVEPQVDHSWIYQRSLLAKYPHQQAVVVARLRDKMNDPAYFLAWEQGNHPPDVLLFERVAELLTTDERASFLGEILDRPSLIESLSLREVLGLYTFFRYGSPDDIVELVGRWAQMHPDIEPEISADFYMVNRDPYRELCTLLYWQIPAHLGRLEQQYLLLPDGGCCLPIAYVVATANSGRGTIDDWITMLEERLGDRELTGDRRVNWLLARAQAQELRHCRPGRHIADRIRPLAGRQWLEEASLVAQTESNKRRAIKEIVARLAATGRYDEAEQLIQSFEGRLTSPESTAEIAIWRTELAQVEETQQERAEQRAQAARSAYLVELERRLTLAQARQDDAAVARYEQLIARFSSSSNQDDPSD